MNAKSTSEITLETTERQQKYVAEQESRGDTLGLVFADAFIRGMRDIGYKNNAWALCEQIDNAIQAGASAIAVQFGYSKSNKSDCKPDMLAIVDNGVGMIPKMISYAVRWGGTDRENSRDGFGRYGYGLPSSSVSIARRYTVYSKTNSGTWHSVTVDIDELARAAGDIDRTNELLQAREADLPKWIVIKDHYLDISKSESGTVIVLEDMDRLLWKTAANLKSKLMQHFGVVYRHWLPMPKLIVDESLVEPVDPLFLMENSLFFDETDVRARRVPTNAFEVETSRGTKGRVKIRASFLPANFQHEDPTRSGPGSNLAHRHKIMRDYNGLLICREGRQIDCIQPRWTKFQTYDYNVKIEVDFEPELDEFFGLTTAKQQIVIDEVMWDKLEQVGGLRNIVKDIRRAFKENLDELTAKRDEDLGATEPRASELAMMETEKFKNRPDKPSDKKKADARKNLEDVATKVAEASGRPTEDIIDELEVRAEKRRFEVEFQAMPEGPFYRPRRLGEQKRLVLNTQHPFYTKVYTISDEIKSALEVLLLVLGEAELEAEGELETFYRSARTGWSERLRYALDKLCPDDVMRDKASAVAEQLQVAASDE